MAASAGKEPTKDDILESLSKSAREAIADALGGCQRLYRFSDALLDLVQGFVEGNELNKGVDLLSRLEGYLKAVQNVGACQLTHLGRVKNLSLHPFGSSVMGVSTRGGDLDVSLEGEIDSEGTAHWGECSDGRTDSRNFKVGLLEEVQLILMMGNHFSWKESSQLIREAKVPVCKFVERCSETRCDLSIGNTSAVFKSHVLAQVLEIDYRVRNLVVLVKKWAKANELNDPKTGSFNSFCLTLLVVAFVQTRCPPLLPPFRDLFPELRNDVSEHANPGGPSLLSLVDVYQQRTSAWVEDFARNGNKNEEILCELLLGFFATLSLFATHSQLARSTAGGIVRPTASVWDGGFVGIRWEPKVLKDYQLFVEDPFEAKDNCARTLKSETWWRISNKLQEAVEAVQCFMCAKTQQNWQELHLTLFKENPRMAAEEEGALSVEDSEDVPSCLLDLHRSVLSAHLERFRKSDRRLIAVRDSWWSREVVAKCIMTQELRLFHGGGAQKKLLISKDTDMKEALVADAVNGTLSATKNQSSIIDPFECVFKQRLREFFSKTKLQLRCFPASAFKEEMRDWALRCAQEEGLVAMFMESGNLRVERTPAWPTNKAECTADRCSATLECGDHEDGLATDAGESESDIANGLVGESTECEFVEATGESSLSPPLDRELHRRNREILTDVFLEIYDRLEILQQPCNTSRVVDINPTDFIAPVSWVRHQVRDIAGYLSLEVLPGDANKRGVKKIKVRKPSDDFDDYSEDRKKRRTRKRFGRPNNELAEDGQVPLSRSLADPDDHVSNCLTWVRERNRGYGFWKDIFPPHVQQGIRDRAEDLSLGVAVEGSKMYVGPEVPFGSPGAEQGTQRLPLDVLNREVVLAHQTYLNNVMHEMKRSGQDVITIPSKGFVMRSRWVQREAIRIAGNYGLDVVVRNYRIDVVNRSQEQPPVLLLAPDVWSGGYWPGPW